MSLTGESNFNADVLANNLHTALIAGKDFSLPALDLESVDFDYPSEIGNPLYVDITRMSEADLTTRVIGGAGIFDGMMVAVSAHLQQEYMAGRISGSDYATTYIQMTAAVLGSSVQFLLAKDQAYWAAINAQMQARTAEILAVNSRLTVEVTRAQLAVARVQLDQSTVDYALGKMKLTNEDIQYALGQAQLAGLTYTNTNLLPAELAGKVAVTAGQTYQNANTMPAQYQAILKQTETADYQLTYLLPKELEKATKGIELATTQISHMTAQKDQVLYQTSAILPSQNANVQADTNTKVYQLTAVLPAQVAGLTADNVGKVYSNTYLLPANLESINEGNEGKRAQTLNTRSDGITVVAGLIGKQKDLYDQQIGSYKRADESKVAKMLLDTWITQKSMDEGLTPPTSLTDSNINTVMTRVRTNLELLT